MKYTFNKLLSIILILSLTTTLVSIKIVGEETYHSNHNTIFNNDSLTLDDEAATPYYYLESGEYYLNNDLKLDKDFRILNDATVKICLNGHVLDMGNHTIKNCGNLYICDCDINTKHYFIERAEDESVMISDTVSVTALKGSWKIVDYTTDKNVVGGVITNASNSVIDNDLESGVLHLSNINFVGNYIGPCIKGNGEIFIDDCNFYGNHSTSSGSSVKNDAASNTLTINNSIFKYNISDDNGGAIYSLAKSEIKNSVFTNNYAKQGGALFLSTNSYKLENTKITNNTALNNGGGMYMNTNNNCLAKGTLITMADGTLKRIEDVKVGDTIKTFDHTIGNFSSNRVYIAYKGISKAIPFTLNFENNKTLSIVDKHDLLEKDSLKYITININNADDYIGKYFYDATNEQWLKLLSVTNNQIPVEYYSIYSENNYNCIANDMLTVPDDVDYMLNVFDFDTNLKINEYKKAADIKKYGLLKYEDCNYCTREEYDSLNIAYLKIIVGKGLRTYEELIESLKEGEDLSDSQKESNTLFNDLLDFISPKVVKAAELTIKNRVLTIGSNVVIKDNTVNGKKDNLCLSSPSNNILYHFINVVDIIPGSTGIDIGINHGEITAVFGLENEFNYADSFKSDSNIVCVVYNQNKELELVKNYDFSIIPENAKEIILNSFNADEAKIIAEIEIKDPLTTDIVVYGKEDENYKTIKYNGSEWEESTDLVFDTLIDENRTDSYYVIGTVKMSNIELINTNSGDCSVKEDGSGYAEYNKGDVKDTTMHIKTLERYETDDNITVKYNNQILKQGRDYTVTDGSLKVNILSSFINSLPLGTNKVTCSVYDKELSCVYSFELFIKINEVKKEKQQYADTTCETVIGKDWTWDEELGVCKLKGYRIVNTSTN